MNWQDWDEGELPAPLPAPHDLEEARRRLDTFGYVILRNHLEPSAIQAIRQRLIDQGAAELAVGKAQVVDTARLEANKDEAEWHANPTSIRPGREQFVLNLFNKGDEFRPLLLHPTIQVLVGHVLGARFQLSSWLGSILHPGAPLMGLHTDQWWINQPVARSGSGQKSGDVTRVKPRPALSNDPLERINPAYAVQTIWMLTDFSEENGATRIVPKSHLSGVVPEPVTPHPYRSIAAEGEAGSVLLYDARMWHSAGAHHGDALRYALHGTFVGPQIRTQENWFLSLRPEVRRELPRELLDMLGFRTWWAYGSTDSIYAETIDPDAVPIGRLELS